jgi:hypothetical protein
VRVYIPIITRQRQRPRHISTRGATARATRDDARDDDARDVDDDARDRGGGRGARPARRSREGEDADADG